MQVEFTMLDPHVRLPLQHDGNGTFSVRFKVCLGGMHVMLAWKQ